MEEKKELDRLLVSYLLKELNAEEEAKVIKAVYSDPDLFQHFEELKNVFRLLEIKQNIDGINLTEERRRFDEIYVGKQNTVSKVVPLLYGIPGGIDVPKQPKSYKFLRAIAVAASAVLILGIGWQMFQKSEGKDSSIANRKQTEYSQKLVTRNELNVSGGVKIFPLNDGTKITLWDQSSVTFEDPFSENKREINLKGKAAFNVAKDKTRPFSVYSGDLITTALGTEFVVTNFKDAQDIIVQLIEGKVVINSAENAKAKLKTPVYLLAGQELYYNKQTGAVTIRKLLKKSSIDDLATNKNSDHDNPSLPENSKGSWYMFNNQPLPQIFDQLEQMFDVQILYNRKDMERLYFIGKFDKTDSLEYILTNITTINNLALSKQENKFLIYSKSLNKK